MADRRSSPATPPVAVVVPAHAPSWQLRACLASLRACDPAPDEVVVVVDGADPDTVDLATPTADRIVELADARGPARARNAGVAATRAEVVLFLDSDVVVPGDVVARLREVFVERPEVAAVIGSYDQSPPAPGLLSQYKNLLNHYMHQTAEVEATTFWGACGAVRRTAFDDVGGFDEAYTRPCIEDIELGHRLRAAGHRVQVVADLQVTHLKQWTPASLLRADVRDRAVPWSELIVARTGFTDDLNVSRRQRVKVATAAVTALAGLLAPASRGARGVTALGVVALAVADLPLLRFFARARGAGFAVVAALWHWWSYLYSAAAYAVVVGRHLLGRLPGGAARAERASGGG